MAQQTTTRKRRSANPKDGRTVSIFENERIQKILESITGRFFTLDNQWRFTYVNQQTEELLHKNQSDLLGLSIWDEFRQAADSTFYVQCHKALSEQTAIKFEYFYAPLGVWFEVHATPSEDGLFVYFDDITKRKLSEQALRESEANYRTIFDAVDDAV